MNNYNYILKLLNFQENNITIKHVDFQDNSYFISLTQTKNDTFPCPNCGGLKCTIHGKYVRTIKHTSINGYPANIKLIQLRLKCSYCAKTFNQDNNIVQKGSIVSNDVKKTIIEETKLKQSFKDISKRTNVSETTISNEFKKQLHDYRCKLSRVICIDEFKANTIAGKYALIIGNPISGEILDILPSRLQDYIYYYFNSIDKSERLNVEFVVTDLFESYRTIAKNLFWNSIHVADRFHWIRLCTEAFNKTRISLMNLHLKTNDKDSITYANVLKKYYKLLLTNPYNKDSWYYYQQVGQNRLGFTTYQSVIEYCVNKDKDFEEAFTLLQKLYYISRYSSYETARKDILDWCDRIDNTEYIIPEFKKVSSTYRSWINEIVNSFILDPITHKRLSNGFIEGKNNFCKVIKRIGFGYKDFDVFRYKILKSNKK